MSKQSISDPTLKMAALPGRRQPLAMPGIKVPPTPRIGPSGTPKAELGTDVPVPRMQLTSKPGEEGIPGLKRGTKKAKRTMVVRIHKGERVVPAKMNAKLGDMRNSTMLKMLSGSKRHASQK
jgi:hypothetical protein